MGPPRRSFSDDSVGWLVSGSGLVLLCLGWTLLSSRFEYGRGHRERPILEFLILYGLVWLCFAGALWLLKRSQGRGPLGWILLVALLARAVLLPSQLVQENDVYRYVLDGQVLRWAGNPYQFSPLVVSDLADSPLREELTRPEARRVLSRIGYPEIPTVYPPVAQLAFALGSLLAGWDWMGQRWIFLVVDLATLGVLLWLLASLGMSLNWVLLYAWNPLVLKEIVNSVHLDGLVALWLLFALVGFVCFQGCGRQAWACFSGVALGLAILSKLYPVILLPAGYLFLRRHSRSNRLSAEVFILASMLVVALGLVPFFWVGWERLTKGIGTYAARWTMNEGAFGILNLITDRPRLLCATLIGLLALCIPWMRRSQTTTELVLDFQWVLLFWFLLIPSPFPWYAVPLVALLPITVAGAPPLTVGVGLSGLLGLYYLRFFYGYHDMDSFWWAATKGVEHGMAWLVLVSSVVYQTAVGLKRSAP